MHTKLYSVPPGEKAYIWRNNGCYFCTIRNYKPYVWLWTKYAWVKINTEYNWAECVYRTNMFSLCNKCPLFCCAVPCNCKLPLSICFLVSKFDPVWTLDQLLLWCLFSFFKKVFLPRNHREIRCHHGVISWCLITKGYRNTGGTQRHRSEWQLFALRDNAMQPNTVGYVLI